jgi:hypothetical protein
MLGLGLGLTTDLWQPAVGVALRQQVEALDDPGAVGPRIATTPINPLSLPAGMSLSGSAITINTPGTYTGHDFQPYRVKVAAANVTLEDCIIIDPGTLGSAAYLFETDTGGTDAILDYCHVEGSGNPRRTDDPTANGPGASFLMSQARCKVRRCRLLNFPSDGIKITGDQAVAEQNYIGSARSVPDYPAYDSGSTYVLNDWVLYNGRPYRAKGSVAAGSAPTGTSSSNADWDAPAPHTDYITVLAGTGARVRYNLFEAEDGAFLGATQYIRVIRNTGSPAVLKDVQSYGNVFRTWPGAYPLAAGYARPVEDLANYDAGDIVFQTNRFWQALVAISGSGDYPDVAPAKWQEIVDTNAGNVLFAHNWMAAGSSGPFYPFDPHNGQIVVASNKMAADESAYVPRDGMTVLETIPEPAFGADLAYTAPAVQYTGSDVSITPTAYGKFRVGGATIDACVIRAGARVYCYITPGGVATVPAGVPATVEDAGGGSFVLRLRDLGGNPISGPISVAAGAATVAEYVAVRTVVVGILSQSPGFYWTDASSAYQSASVAKETLTNEDDIYIGTGSGRSDIETWPITNANGLYSLNRLNAGIMRLSKLLHNWHEADLLADVPSYEPVRFVFVQHCKSGVGRAPAWQDDALSGVGGRPVEDVGGADGWDWEDDLALVAAAEAYGPYDMIIEANWTANDASALPNFLTNYAPWMFGERAGGGTFTLGAANPDSGITYFVDYCLFDKTAATVNDKGRGTFARSTKWTYFVDRDTDLDGIAGYAAAYADARVQVFAGPMTHDGALHSHENGADHALKNDVYGQNNACLPAAIAIARYLGLTVGGGLVGLPEVTVDFATDGTYMDVTVSNVPAGSEISTIAAQDGISAVSADDFQTFHGFQIQRGGEAFVNRQALMATTSGQASNRKGSTALQSDLVLRVTFTEALDSGDVVWFGVENETSPARPSGEAQGGANLLFRWHPVVVIPGMRDEGDTYKYPGIPLPRCSAVYSSGAAMPTPKLTVAAGSPNSMFRDTANVPANTSRLKGSLSLYMPARHSGSTFLFNQSTNAWRLEITAAGKMVVSVQNSAPTTVLPATTVVDDLGADVVLPLATRLDISLDVDHTPGEATVTVNGTAYPTLTFTSGTGFQRQSTPIVIGASSAAGASVWPAGWEVANILIERNGATHKTISNDPETANADAWQVGADFV